ncbi:cardiolipin synthase ClsB [Desulfotignum phosphitoxidans]|uniref:Phospholipase D/transphosphatidylase Pld n=1 Tax=Desulfotignum phosphitoxidans DSM 13687 TaxID=1286635 RepID=S0G7Y5_9BACT|nr:cardiolipin synthase ClsB [Desulfotignum phosphitoxidans]EMS81577.1 phospholipase D/transphosphatidylase Pld [Desulfotignum phosphitoxidans DSM 13687]
MAGIRFVPGNQITLLENGETYFPVMEAALDRAKHEIFLISYIFQNDTIGRRIADVLKRAALRGVKTCVLIDGFGSDNLPETMVADLNAAGVMVMKFRPGISPWTFRRRRLRRLHRKIVIVDQTAAFVGGINILDDFDTPDQPSPRYDYAVHVEGPLVRDILVSTQRLWSRVIQTRLRIRPRFSTRDRDQDRQAVFPESGGRMRAAFLARDNIRHRRDIEDAYMQAIEQAQVEIILANAYFFPGSKFRRALVDAAGRGVRVVLFLQGKKEYRLLYYASKALYGSFLDAGIQIHEYHNSLMHAKVAVIDEQWSTVGSSNLDPFSLLLSLEANVVVDDKKFAGTLKRSLEKAMAAGACQIRPNRWKRQSIRLRMVSWLCYGLVRFMTGMTGYAPGKDSG